MNKNDSTFILHWAKKIKAINYLGGQCSVCGEVDYVCLTFHHEKVKNFKIRKDSRWSVIEKELDNCVLLCNNCHGETHRNLSRNGNEKENLLSKLGLNKCSVCGYSGKNFASLVFHHIDRDQKSFAINDFVARKRRCISLSDLMEEISKCMLICRNCHLKKHLDSRFEKFKQEILEKSTSYTEENAPIGDEKIMNMILSGLKQVEICRELKSPKSTIATIVNRLRNKGLLPK